MHPSRTAIAASAAWIYGSALTTVLGQNEGNMFSKSYGGHFQFLTILGITISLAQATISVLGEVSGVHILQVLADLLLQVSAPVELLISILYWGIRAIDVNLVLDPRVDIRLPGHVDRQLHLWPAILQSLAAMVAVRPWVDGIFGPLLRFCALAAGYHSWVNITFSHNGFYPYPLLAVVDSTQRSLIFAGAGFLVFGCFKALQAAQRKVR